MKKKMSELVTGDVVTVQYGLKVRVEALESRALREGTSEAGIREGLIQEGHKPFIYWTTGTALNVAEAIENGFPNGYLGRKGDTRTWVIAGNDRRIVEVEGE